VSQTAQLTHNGNGGVHVTNAGIENLSTYGGADGEVRFEAAAYSWAKNIEVTQWIGGKRSFDHNSDGLIFCRHAARFGASRCEFVSRALGRPGPGHELVET
jgi:hypothetical protein